MTLKSVVVLVGGLSKIQVVLVITHLLELLTNLRAMHLSHKVDQELRIVLLNAVFLYNVLSVVCDAM